MRIFFYITLILFTTVALNATHNRAGEITYKQVSGLTYEITVTTFTYSKSQVRRDSLGIDWGDNTYSFVTLTDIFNIGEDYIKSIFTSSHTFSGPGVFTLLVEDPNRNEGIINIPNSVNTIFSIQSQLRINSFLGPNNTPILLNPPIDRAAVNRIFTHNPGAYDIDGDSLSYKLISCTADGGQAINNYTLPKASKSISINPVTGDLIWDTPTETGNYNIAILIEEWREKLLIGSVTRDMQISVYNSQNRPPINQNLKNYCFIAGDTIRISFEAIDPDNDPVSLEVFGGLFENAKNNISFSSFYDAVEKTARGTITWISNCNDVNNAPYTIIIKSTDSNNEINLTDIDNFTINIIAPPPILKTIISYGEEIHLHWNKYKCANATSFLIYRRQDNFPYVADSCKGDVPPNNGYKLISSTISINDSIFIDKNSLGTGNYCYVIVAVFSDQAKSLPSNELCTSIEPGTPALIKTSVEKIDSVNGHIELKWIKPVLPDSLKTGNYKINIFRSSIGTINPVDLVSSFFTNNLDDTTFIDTLVNTLQFPYYYRMELYANTNGINVLIDKKQDIASTIYPNIHFFDRKLKLEINKSVPWINEKYIIYRKNENTQLYDSIGYTPNLFYEDSLLQNGLNYCYKIKSIGYRKINTLTYLTENFSHIACATPKDTLPPAVPKLSVSSVCDSLYNYLSWQYTGNKNELKGFKLYYTSDTIIKNLTLIAVLNPNDSIYIHKPSLSLAGSYLITALDSTGNESSKNYLTSVDECRYYSLPNVFTPNGDGVDDFFKPYKYSFVKRIEIKIFNRWGGLVYETTNPDINWDGKDMFTKQKMASGVFYYVCHVYEERITGIEVRTLYNFIYLFSDPIVPVNTEPNKE